MILLIKIFDGDDDDDHSGGPGTRGRRVFRADDHLDGGSPDPWCHEQDPWSGTGGSGVGPPRKAPRRQVAGVAVLPEDDVHPVPDHCGVLWPCAGAADSLSLRISRRRLGT